MVSRRPHKPEIIGSSPIPAMCYPSQCPGLGGFFYILTTNILFFLFIPRYTQIKTAQHKKTRREGQNGDGDGSRPEDVSG
jgi:hypothetical protein